jgi:hypothetical protein
MNIHKFFTGLGLLLIFCGAASLAVADDHWSDDWKIEVGGRAKSAGTISFELTFEPGEDGTAADAISIDVLVADDSKDNEVAGIITNNFEAVLGEDNFKINQSWGENVTVKARGETTDFALAMTNNSVQGISLEIKD